MVASISARGGVQAALGYYGHLGQDDYYTRGSEPPGGWAGEAAARLSLSRPVTRTEFEAALRGFDPKTGERLANLGGRDKQHAAGWDMTFSAPKSVSVLWALSDPKHRPAIERAQQLAVQTATRHLELTSGWARRGKGGAIKEQTAGLLMATFDHHTSRDLDPQLHTHVFIFNLAPRKDGTWGAIVSRELYKAQKQAGAVYREALAQQLERDGIATERSETNFRVSVTPRDVERVFSKRREAIEAAAAVHCYRTPKGMEAATLRTRKAKRTVGREALFTQWREEARACGFELNRVNVRGAEAQPIQRVAGLERPIQTPAVLQSSSQIGAAANQLSASARVLDQPAAMPGVAINLRQREQGDARGR